MLDVAILSYVALSLVIGGAAAAYEIWHQPTMLDRADGRGKFPSPKMTIGEVILFGVLTSLLWPLEVFFIDEWG